MSTENPPDDFTEEERELLSNVSEIAQSITDDDRVRETPPPDIWAAISNEVSGSVESETTHSDDSASDGAALIDLTTERTAREQVSTTPLVGQPQKRSPLLLVAAAILGLVVIGGAALTFLGGASSNIEYAAEITNADLPEAFEGTAAVELDDESQLMINFDSELPSDEPVELWLIRPDLSDMVSLGIVQPGNTTWEIPEGIDPSEYSVVDLSIEPDDGDETHSGRSILRGQLQTST